MANKEINEKIRKFKNDPIYGQCYDSILEQIAFFAKTYEKIDISLAICEIFETTDEYVNRVVTADIPEIEINNITSEICWSHKEPTTRTNGMLISTLTPIKIIGSFIEMLFIVKVFDTIENKDKSIMNALHNCRMHCENYNLSHFYTRSDIWKLIAERIIPDSPRIREDYEQLYLKQKSICEKQEKEIEELKAQITETSDSDIEATEDIHQKVTLETFYHLLEIGGTDFNKTGAKANAARLASYITKIPEPACKNYATHRDVNTNTHKVEIVKINSQLQALSLKPI